ncbi:MAG: hypothetical protein IKT00_02800 [Prevotella sp.]|nr:hypothetical protein [Prevotella sp.]
MAPQAKVVAVSSGSLLGESLPIHEEEESPHVTEDSQVYAQPNNVWEEEHQE